MSLRLNLLNLALRLIEKPRLARARDVGRLRASLSRTARTLFRDPPGMRRQPGRAPGPVGWVPLDWVSRGPVRRERVLIYLHGGAFAIGGADTHRHLAADIAGHAQARAVLPEYRLAPEHPFPAAIEDAYAVYRHLLDTGYAPKNIALAGDSAGGGLAAALLLKAAEAGAPPPLCVMLLSPFVDLRLTAASIRANARRDPLLPASRLGAVVEGYLGGVTATHPLASPVLGAFQRPPPMLIQVGSTEILRDDSETLAQRLRDCGGDVRLEVWPAAPHVWQIWRGRLREADLAVARLGGFLAEMYGRGDAHD